MEGTVPVENVEPVAEQPVEVVVGRHDEYDFRNVKVEMGRGPEGTRAPILSARVVREKNGAWEEIGYFRVRLMKVKRDDADVEDLGISFISRVNPKA